MAEKLDTEKFVQLFLKGYVPKSKDEDKFAKKHVAKRNSDRNGNGDDVFNATNVPEYDRTKGRHGYKSGDDVAVYEAALSPAEMRQREKIVRAMKRSGDFKKRYGKDAKAVMYATATKLANEGFIIEEEHDEDAVIYVDDLIETLAEIEEARAPRKAKHHTDPYSQPPSPNEVEAEGDRKKRFADVSVIEQILLQMTEEVVEVHFEDGDTALLDTQAATDIIEAYLNLDEESQQTFDSTLSEGIEGFEAGMSFLAPAVDALDEAKEDYSKSTDISKLRKMLARHSDMAVKYNGAGDDEKVKYHQVQMNKIKRRMGVLVREDLEAAGLEYDMLGEEALDEKYDKYIATSEPSKLSKGHRAKLLAPEGHVSYLSQKAYKTPKHARDAATYYHDLTNQRLHYNAIDRKMGEYNKAYDEKHGIKEDVEQIDELSKRTLAKYVKKSATDMQNKSVDAGYVDASDYPFDKDEQRKRLGKILNRKIGINRAVDRLAEEAEQIDEMSSDKLIKYHDERARWHDNEAEKHWGERRDANDEDDDDAAEYHSEAENDHEEAADAHRKAAEAHRKDKPEKHELTKTAKWHTDHLRTLYKEEALQEVSPELKVRYAEARFKDIHDKRMSGDLKKMSPKKVQRQVDRATKAWNQGMDVIRSERSTFKDPLAGMKPYRRQDYDEYGNMREGVEALAEISADVARLVQKKREARARAADLRGDVEAGHAEMKKAVTAKRRADDKEMKEAVDDDLAPVRKAPKRDTSDIGTIADKNFPGRHHVFWKGKKLNVRISNADAGVWGGRGRGSNRGNNHYVEYIKDGNVTHTSKRIGTLAMAKDHIYDLMMKKEAMKEDVEVVSEVDKAKYIRAAVDDIAIDSNYQGWKYGTKHPKDPINRSDTSAREEKRKRGIDLAMRLMQRGKK